ncbi:MAG: hypothetical protein MI742_10605 [Desulfobacterales bacterium]|nr:hypothetical protein [Desulfobacterales bacterium]
MIFKREALAENAGASLFLAKNVWNLSERDEETNGYKSEINQISIDTQPLCDILEAHLLLGKIQ